MPQRLNMSLDDLNGNTRNPGGYDGHFRGRGRGFGPGPARRFTNRNPVRTAPYSNQPMQVEGSMVEQRVEVSGGTNAEEGTKLYLSNLDYGVSNSDIELLFAEVGGLKRHSIHYDKSGRSKGTAEVVFARHSDALAAIKRYNNVRLDGKPMKIELVGMNPVTPVPVPPSTNSLLGRPNLGFQSGRGSVGSRGLFHGRGGFGLARGRGQVRGHAEKVTAEDLDADLEKYHLEAMRIKRHRK